MVRSRLAVGFVFLAWPALAAAAQRSMYFDGVDDQVSRAGATNLNGARQATWSFWFKYDGAWAAGGDAQLLGRGDSPTNRQYSFRADQGTDGVRDGSLLFIINPTGSTSASWRTPVHLGLSASGFSRIRSSWHHIVVVFDGTRERPEDRLRVYRNGGLIDGQGPEPANRRYYTGTFPAALSSVPGNLYLGASNAAGAARFRKGRLDEVAIWRDVAASPKQAAEIFGVGVPGDLSRGSLGPPQNWWKGDGDFTDSGSLRYHAAQAGGVAFKDTARGVVHRRHGRFDVASFSEAGSEWAVTVEGDLCGAGPAACGNVLKVDWTSCRAASCAERRARWKAAIHAGTLVEVQGYQFLPGVDARPLISPSDTAVPGEGFDPVDIPTASPGDYYDDISLTGWNTCLAGEPGCTYCVNDVMDNFAAIERRTRHRSAFYVRAGHHVSFDPLWDAEHYQGIARLPDNPSNPEIPARTPVFAVTAHNPGRLWRLPMLSKGAGGPYPQLAENSKIGTNRLVFGEDEEDAELREDGSGWAYDRTHGAYYTTYGDHLGGLQAAGARWLAVATDAADQPGSPIGPHQGGALLFRMDSLADQGPSQVVDKVVASGDKQVYLDETGSVGAVAIVKLKSGFYLLDLQSHAYHAFFLSDTTDLETTSRWHFIGQRVLGAPVGDLEPEHYQAINLFAQCSDRRLFLAGFGNTLDGGTKLNDWDGDDRVALHVVDGTVRVRRDGATGRIKSIRDPGTDLLWGAAWSWSGADGHAPYGHYHLAPGETDNSLFVKLDAEAGHTPVSHHFHLDGTEFRAGGSVFVNKNYDLMVYAVERAAPNGAEHLDFQEFPNRNSLGLRGSNFCSRPEEEWIAFYRSPDCRTDADHEVNIYDRYFAPDRNAEDFGQFNDFHDVATCVRACVGPGRSWSVCEGSGLVNCQSSGASTPAGGTVLQPPVRGQASSAAIVP